VRITVSRRSEVLVRVLIICYHAGVQKVHIEDGQILVLLSAVSTSISQLFIGFYAAGVLGIPPDVAFFVFFTATRDAQSEMLISYYRAHTVMLLQD
jgi:hypothetical protein